MLERSQPDMSGTDDARQRENDRLFVIALAKAFMRGDHLLAAPVQQPRKRPVPLRFKAPEDTND